ncbi:Uu.00g003410.m01.CDS01 [Anthostomella pinea]|uniref:Uu.00g003410.m01.CDS01 n=1 Tax=Anthostomella pinea TaxID=933095 RepID=A0AAI8YIL3_9PEZI|nr:Uu.00g003410.m01.CDS01 [Anthostomella pinea]
MSFIREEGPPPMAFGAPIPMRIKREEAPPPPKQEFNFNEAPKQPNFKHEDGEGRASLHSIPQFQAPAPSALKHEEYADEKKPLAKGRRGDRSRRGLRPAHRAGRHPVRIKISTIVDVQLPHGPVWRASYVARQRRVVVHINARVNSKSTFTLDHDEHIQRQSECAIPLIARALNAHPEVPVFLEPRSTMHHVKAPGELTGFNWAFEVDVYKKEFYWQILQV